MIVAPLALIELLFAADPIASVHLAEQLCRERQYERAAAIYDGLGRDRVCSPRFYQVQGNAHFLAGHVPQAILAYRRALREQPRDDALLENLADARSRVVDSPGHESVAGLRSMSPFWFLIVATGGYVCAWLALCVWISAPHSWLWLVGSVLLLASVAIAAFPFLSSLFDDRRPISVIAEDGVALRRGNGLSYEPVEHAGQLVWLNRGVEARVRAARPNGWVQLELENGVIGWAPRGQLLIEP
jgi:hypothetical protein